jgi:hypothetical protein
MHKQLNLKETLNTKGTKYSKVFSLIVTAPFTLSELSVLRVRKEVLL